MLSKFTLTASMMFLVATTDTPLSATPWEGEGGHFVHFLPFFVVKKMFHLLYVSKHHLLTGRLNLLDQTDQKTSSTLRPPVCHVMSLIPCHRTMTSGKNMHMFLSKSLYVVFATGLLHYRCSYPVTCRPDICHFFSTNVLLGSIFLHMKNDKTA